MLQERLKPVEYITTATLPIGKIDITAKEKGSITSLFLFFINLKFEWNFNVF